MGMKSDDANIVPLCFRHHHILHTKYGNELKFFKHYWDDEDYGKKLAKALFEEGTR